MKRRFNYVCNVFADSVKSRRGITSDSPAATRKVSSLCHAVRKAGGDVLIISLGRGRSNGTGIKYPATAGRIGKVPIVYLDYWDIPVVTHLITSFSLTVIMFRLTCRRSVLIFYNSQIHYFGALIMGWLFRRHCILDIEDGCLVGEKNVRNTLNNLLFEIYSSCCKGGAMLASISLKQQTHATKTYVCYGVADSQDVKKDWAVAPLQVLFGGSLLKDTGATLFLDALLLLMKQYPDDLKKLKFVVTGFGEFAEHIKNMAMGEMREFLSYRGNVTNNEYRQIMRKSHIGLCLKLPSSSMGATTFPSKVVEYASSGLLVVSTKVSDVPLLFNDATAYLLKEATPHSLVQSLASICNDPESARKIALSGRKRISSLLSEEKVGAELLNFWQGIFETK